MAASGASFAQATISGQLGLSWQQNPTIKSDGSHIQGLSMNDGEIYVAATEDMGGGMSATARGGWVMRGRGTAITARDATVTLKGNFGAVTAGSLRTCGSLVTVQSGVVTCTVYTANESVDYVPLDKCSIVDTVAYSVPVGPVVVTASYGEFAKPENYSTDATKNSLDSKGNINGITYWDLDGTYNDGPLMLRMNVTSFSAITNVSIGGVTALVPADGIVRTRLVGSYDAGVAKFGLGYQNKTGGTADQYVASIAIPAGNAVFGLDYTARAAQGVFDKGAPGAAAAFALTSARNGDKASSSVGLGVTYNFSKTTNINASYITYNDAGANTLMNAANTAAGTTAALLDTEYRIRLLKTF